MRAVAITAVKNEGAFLLEWLAHHLVLGFDHVLVFSNDCEDGTDAMLDRLAALGHVTHLRNPGPWPRGPQWSALKAAGRHPRVKAADWLMVLDVDEFVNIHVGDHRLPALWSALPEATAIPLTWRMFGNAGVVAYEDRPVTEVFTRAAPAALPWPWRAALFKTLFRNDGTYGRLGVHRPRDPDPARLEQARWFDGSGRPLGGDFLTTRIFSDFGRDCYGLAQLNHYALGAMESYIVKCDRGRANREIGPFDMSYWVDRNFDTIEDRSIAALDSRPLRAALLADPELARLHAAAVQWRHDRFTELMTEESWRALFGRLLITPASRVLSPAEARLIWRHSPAMRPPAT